MRRPLQKAAEIHEPLVQVLQPDTGHGYGSAIGAFGRPSYKEAKAPFQRISHPIQQVVGIASFYHVVPDSILRNKVAGAGMWLPLEVVGGNSERSRSQQSTQYCHDFQTLIRHDLSAFFRPQQARRFLDFVLKGDLNGKSPGDYTDTFEDEILNDYKAQNFTSMLINEDFENAYRLTPKNTIKKWLHQKV